MKPNSKRLFNNFTTNRASLGCSFGIDFFISSASIFGFALEDRKKYAPCGIGNAFRKMRIPNHSLNVEVFYSDEIILLDKFMSDLMTEIKTLITDFLMTFSNKATGFASSMTAFYPTGKSLLSRLELLFRDAEKFGGINLFAVTCRDKRIKADIDADAFSGRKQKHGPTFNDKKNIPPCITSIDAQSFDFTVNRTVPLDFNATDVLKVEFVCLNLATITKCGIVDRVEAVGSLEAGITRLFACLHSAEKGRERLIKSAKGLLKRTIVAKCKTLRFLSQLRQKHCSLSRIIDSLPRRPVSLFSLLKSFVVEKTMCIKLRLKRSDLLSSGIETIFKGFEHLLSFLFLNIFTDSGLAYIPDTASIIASAPKRRQTATKGSKFTSHKATGVSLQSIDDLCDTQCWVIFKKQMNVIGHYLKGMYCQIKLFHLFIQELLQPLSYIALKHGSPIFWTPYQMQFQTEYGTCVFCILSHTNILYTMQILNANKISKGGRRFTCHLKETVPSPRILW